MPHDQPTHAPDDKHPPREEYWLRDTDSQRAMVARSAAKQAAFLLPHLRPGMRLLDCGSGPGSITVDLASLVAPGEVVGIDLGPSDVEQARALAKARGVDNVRFELADIYGLPFADASFDAVFSNAVFDHLSRPLDALREMYRVLKPGGVAGVRAADADGYLVYPPCPALDKYGEWGTRLKESQGVNRRIGKQLRTLFHQAGFTDVEASASYDAYGTSDRVRKSAAAMAISMSNSKRAEAFIQRGWTTQTELDGLAAELRAWAEDPGAFVAQSLGEAVGWRPQD